MCGWRVFIIFNNVVTGPSSARERASVLKLNLRELGVLVLFSSMGAYAHKSCIGRRRAPVADATENAAAGTVCGWRVFIIFNNVVAGLSPRASKRASSN